MIKICLNFKPLDWATNDQLNIESTDSKFTLLLPVPFTKVFNFSNRTGWLCSLLWLIGPGIYGT